MATVTVTAVKQATLDGGPVSVDVVFIVTDTTTSVATSYPATTDANGAASVTFPGSDAVSVTVEEVIATGSG